jgi:hypothetical protein
MIVFVITQDINANDAEPIVFEESIILVFDETYKLDNDR